MAGSSTNYEPRQPAQGALYQIVRDHFETFRAQAARSGTARGCPGSSSRSSGTFCSVAGSPAGSRGFAAAPAASTGWCRFRVRGAASARVVAAAGWRSVRPTWSITLPDDECVTSERRPAWRSAFCNPLLAIEVAKPFDLPDKWQAGRDDRRSLGSKAVHQPTREIACLGIAKHEVRLAVAI